MTAAELKEELMIGFTDYEFIFKDKHGSICPYNTASGFLATVNYRNWQKEYRDLDELMSDKILDGKSLEEVATEIEFYG